MNDLNNAPPVTEQDLKDADAVSQQDLKTDAVNQDDKLADGTTKDKTVKYSEFEKANKAKKEAEEAQRLAEEQAAHAQRQLEVIRQQQAQPATEQRTLGSSEQALKDLNLSADDLYGENLLAFQKRKDEIDEQRQLQRQAVTATQQFIVNHSDINEVVGPVNPATGHIVAPSAEVLELVRQKPYLASASLQTLYDAVVTSRKLSEYEKNQAVLSEHQKRQGIDNQTAPLGGSAAGGGAAGDVNQPMMSREQVLEIERKIAAGEAV